MVANAILSADSVRLGQARSLKAPSLERTRAPSGCSRTARGPGFRRRRRRHRVHGTQAAAAPTAATLARARAGSVTVPAQTMVNVRLTEAINVDASKAGATYRAVVDDPVMIDGRVVIPRSAGVVVQAVRVEQSGAIKGSDKISLKPTRSRSAARSTKSSPPMSRRGQAKASGAHERSVVASAWVPSSGASPVAGKGRRLVRRWEG